VWIRVEQHRLRNLNLEPPDIIRSKQRLTMQIRFLNAIVIENHDSPHSGRTQILKHCAPETAGTHDEN